jgi:hypothetical protein
MRRLLVAQERPRKRILSMSSNESECVLFNRVCTLSSEGFINTQESIRRLTLLYDDVDSFFSCMSDEEEREKENKRKALCHFEDTV